MAIKVGKILGRVAKAAAANPAVTVAIVAGVAPGLAAKIVRLAPLVGAVLRESDSSFEAKLDGASHGSDGSDGSDLDKGDRSRIDRV